MLCEPCQENVLWKQRGPNRSKDLCGGRVLYQIPHKQAREEVRLPWPEATCFLPTLSLSKHGRSKLLSPPPAAVYKERTKFRNKYPRAGAPPLPLAPPVLNSSGVSNHKLSGSRRDHTTYCITLLLLLGCPVVSDSLQPCGLQHARPSCPSLSREVCPSSYSLHW